MKVSVITATYNSEQTIIDTLLSLESQTYLDIEYIIIDGGSSDNTIEIIKSNCSRVSYIVSEKDDGIYDALNKGIAAATGDVVGFLHSDDMFAYPNAIRDIVDTFKLDDCDSVYADLEYVSKEKTDKVVRLWKSGRYKKANLRLGWMPPHPTFYMKRELYKQFGIFDLSYKISADYDSLLRYLWVNNVSSGYLPEVLVKMRVGGVSNRSLKNIAQKTKEDIRALRNNNVPLSLAIIGKNISKIPQFLLK